MIGSAAVPLRSASVSIAARRARLPRLSRHRPSLSPAAFVSESAGRNVSLAVGTKLGSFEIVSPLGTGGMGEVYRARDAKLGRDVAIKVLPPTFAHDPDRLTRFTREARLLAALNHPHIATIHGLEDADGAPAIVMELVEGPTLADKLARRTRGAAYGLPVDEGDARRPHLAELARVSDRVHAAAVLERSTSRA